MRNYIIAIALLALILSTTATPLKMAKKNKILAKGPVHQKLSTSAARAIAQAGTYNGVSLTGHSHSNGFNGQKGRAHATVVTNSFTNTVTKTAGPKQYGPVQNKVVRVEQTLSVSSQSGYSNSQSWAQQNRGKKVAWQEQNIQEEAWQENVYETTTEYQTQYVTQVNVKYSNKWDIEAKTNFGVGTCRNFWMESSFSLADATGTPGEWYLNNCEVYSYFYGQYINANDVEWSNPDAEAYYYSSWVCASDSSWRIYFPQNCTWVKGTFLADGEMSAGVIPTVPAPLPTSSWAQPSSVPSTLEAVPFSAIPSTIETVYFPTKSIPATIIESMPTTVLTELPASVISELPSTVQAQLPSTAIPVTIPVSSWVQPTFLPTTEVQVPVTAIPTSVHYVTFDVTTLPPTIVSEMPSTVLATISTPVTVAYIPPSVTVPSTFNTPVIVATTYVQDVPSSHLVYITSGLVALPLSSVPSSVPSAAILTPIVPPSNCACVNTPSNGHFTFVPSFQVTVTISYPVTIPTDVVSPVVIPASFIKSPEYVPWVYTVVGQPSVVVVSLSMVPSSVPVGSIITVPSTLEIVVTPASKPHQTVIVPSTWTDVVVVPASWVTLSTLSPTVGFQTPGMTNSVIFSFSLLPSSIPTAVIATVPNRLISTVAQPTVHDTVYVPYYWSNPVVVPVSEVPSTVDFVTVRHDDTLIVVSAEQVPSSVPAALVVPVPTSKMVTTAIQVSVTETIDVPRSWTSPQVVPISALPSTLPVTEIILVSSAPSVAVVSWHDVRDLPSTVVEPLQSTLVYTVKVPTLSTVVSVPVEWNTPVMVPASYVSSLPSWSVVSVPSNPDVVIVSWTNVPESVPTAVIVSVPSTLIATPIPPECDTVVNYFLAPKTPSDLVI